MKIKKIFILSLLLNLALCLTMIWSYWQQTSKNSPGQQTREEAKELVSKRLRVENQTDSVTKINLVEEKFSWREVESPEYKAYITNLRSIDCPEKTIRHIIIADVEKLYAGRFAALRQQQKESYWKATWGTVEERERQKQFRALSKEKRQLLKELLGVDYRNEMEENYFRSDDLRNQLDFLPEEKLEGALEINEKYQELYLAIHERGLGDLEPEDLQELRQLKKQQLEELGKILTPAELKEYELRSSTVASHMRFQLKEFNPTEKEFRDLFEINKAREENWDLYNFYPQDQEADKKMQEDIKQHFEQIKVVLGEQRYKEFERAQHREYKDLVRLAELEGLSSKVASAVYDVKETVQEQVSKLRNDPSLNEEQRTEALKAVQEETEKTVAETLGQEAYRKYKQRHGGWIENLYREKQK